MSGMTTCSDCGDPYAANESGADALGRCPVCTQAWEDYRMQDETVALARTTPPLDTTALAAVMEKVVRAGDLRHLTPPEQALYYLYVCHTLGLHPGLKPLEWLHTEDGTVTLYLKREGCEQLRAVHELSVTIRSRDYVQDLLVVVAEGVLPSGRRETAEASVSMVSKHGQRLQGQAHARARMICESKAKRRVTLALCGAGLRQTATRLPLALDPETLEEGDDA